MPLDKRGDEVLMYFGDGPSVGKLEIEVGDKVNLHHDGKPIQAKVINRNDKQFIGKIVNSSYDPDSHQNYISGETIEFVEENVFMVSKNAHPS